MASDPTSAASFLEQLINSRNRDLSVFLPLILGFSRSDSSESDPSSTDSDESPDQARGRIVLINPLTQGMIVIESNRSLEDMMREFASKEGPKPATKASIEAMKRVVISEEDDCECPICLEDWEIGGEGKEMPCGHKYHGGCIEKWLGIHGSCPVCRYKMPVDEEDESKKGSEFGEDEERGRRGEIWVSFAFSGRTNSSSADDNNTEINSSN